AFVFPAPAPWVAAIVRFVAPPEHRGRAQHRSSQPAVRDRAIYPLARRIKPALAYGADEGVVLARRCEHRIAVSERGGERFLDGRRDSCARRRDHGGGVLRVGRANAQSFHTSPRIYLGYIGEYSSAVDHIARKH